MKWEYVTLDKLGTVSRGKSKHRPRNDPSLFGGEYPFIQTSDVKNATFYITDYTDTYNEKGLLQSKLWEPNTLCITIAANIADTAILGIKACFPDSVMGFIPFEDVSDVRYVKYSFDMLQTRMKQISQGAAQDNLSWQKLSSITFPKPPYETQKKIADYLFAYEMLIENNQKQIKLLEEAAQRLYKEWFIDLRFPGHETTPIVNGIPEGWTKSTFMDVCSKINAGGTPSRRKREYWENPSIKWFKTGELFDEWLIDSEEMISEDGLFNSSAKLFPQNTIAMAIYASPTLGRLGIFESISACNQAMLCMLADETKITWQWLFFKLYENREKFNAIAKGAGQQNISSDTVKNTAIILPTKQTIDLFTNQVKVTFEKRLILQKQIKSLTEARDRLLPKLMNGEIEV